MLHAARRSSISAEGVCFAGDGVRAPKSGVHVELGGPAITPGALSGGRYCKRLLRISVAAPTEGSCGTEVSRATRRARSQLCWVDPNLARNDSDL
jgi:hypothetical protein